MQEKWNRLSLLARVGVGIMLVSVPLFLSPPIILFLPLDGKTKGGTAFGVFIAAEVLFYGGAALAGKDFVQAIYARFKKKPADEESAPKEL